MTVLVGLAARSIQNHIFASNRLIDVIGASALIEDLFDEQAVLADFDEVETLRTQVLVTGAGRTILAVGDETLARQGIERFSRRQLTTAPGLDVTVVVHQRQHGQLATDLETVNRTLADRSLTSGTNGQLSIPAGVARCSATAGPAATVDQHHRVPLSGQAAEARRHGLAQADWDGRPLPPEFGDVRCQEPTQLDQLGRTVDDRSLIGIIHLDGNGIGAKVQSWAATVQHNDLDDDVALGQYRQWSAGLRDCVDNAWTAVERVVEASLDVADNGQRAWLQGTVDAIDDFELTVNQRYDGTPVVALPIRRVVHGGDDLTFIADGRIALSLAVVAARAYAADLPGLGPVQASVGVALVHAHSPFLRAYDLADQLCRRAKQTHRGQAAIDWQLGLLEPGQRLGDARGTPERAGHTERPYLIDPQPGVFTWHDFDCDLLGTGPTSLRGRHWSRAGSKVKRLPALVRQSPQAVASELQAWRVTDPDLGFPAPYDANGFHENRSPLIDAVDLVARHQIPIGVDIESGTDTP